MMKVVAVVPAYNAEGSVGEVVRELASYVDAIFVVDDGSRDRTGEVARTAGAVVVTHAINRGQGAALKTGGEVALLSGAEVIVHCDADGQHVLSYIPALLAPIKEGRADMVLGSRYMGVKSEGMPWVRRVLHKGIRFFNIAVLGIPSGVTDPQSGFRAMTARAARELDFCQDRMAHCSEILRMATRSPSLVVREVPALVRYTEASLRQGQKAKDALKVVWQLFVGTK